MGAKHKGSSTSREKHKHNTESMDKDKKYNNTGQLTDSTLFNLMFMLVENNFANSTKKLFSKNIELFTPFSFMLTERGSITQKSKDHNTVSCWD